MADPQRLKVDRGLLHHAVTPLWANKSKKELAQWFSDNGFARAYGSNPANWSGLINPFTGGRSYSQTHAVGQRVDNTTPDATAAEKAAGYRVFYIVQDPKGQITWHAGNWEMNRRSIAIENLGDYRNYPLRDGDMRVIADFFRPLDQAVGGAMNILLHNQVYATACPARIAEAQQKIIDYINNPPKPPTPPAAPKWMAMEVPRSMRAPKTVTVLDLGTMKSAGTIKAGADTPFVEKKEQGGNLYVRSQWSKTNGKNWGVLFDDLLEIPKVTTKEETKTEVIAFTKKSENDPTMLVGQKVVKTVGVNGERKIVYTVTLTDGKETGRVIKSSTVTKQPVDEVTLVGTLTKDDQQDQRLGVIERFIEALKKALEKIGIKL